MLRAVFGLARPIILLGVLMVHGAGVAAAFGAGHALNPAALLWGVAALFFVGISINFANEYADHETDALTTKTRYSGGSGVLPKGLVRRGFVLRAAWAALLLGLGAALFGVAAGALSAAAFAVLAAGAFGGWMYSLPPLRLAWNGGAELANGLLGGILLPLYGYALLAGRVDGWVALAFTPYALLVVTTALATTWPDRAADKQVGKRTLATWMPVSGLRAVYVVISALSFILLLFLPFIGVPPQIVVVSFVALPAVIIAARQYTRISNPHPSARASMMLAFAQTFAWLWLGGMV